MLMRALLLSVCSLTTFISPGKTHGKGSSWQQSTTAINCNSNAQKAKLNATARSTSHRPGTCKWYHTAHVGDGCTSPARCVCGARPSTPSSLGATTYGTPVVSSHQLLKYVPRSVALTLRVRARFRAAWPQVDLIRGGAGCVTYRILHAAGSRIWQGDRSCGALHVSARTKIHTVRAPARRAVSHPLLLHVGQVPREDRRGIGLGSVNVDAQAARRDYTDASAGDSWTLARCRAVTVDADASHCQSEAQASSLKTSRTTAGRWALADGLRGRWGGRSCGASGARREMVRPTPKRVAVAIAIRSSGMWPPSTVGSSPHPCPRLSRLDREPPDSLHAGHAASEQYEVYFHWCVLTFGCGARGGDGGPRAPVVP